jgi:hypothetical protein
MRCAIADHSIVGDLDSSQPDMVAGRKSMNIEARPQSHDKTRAIAVQALLGLFEIFHSRELHVGRISLEHAHGQIGPLCKGAVVTKILSTFL